MQTWLRSVVDKILGGVPGKTSQLHTATRVAKDAFSASDWPKVVVRACT